MFAALGLFAAGAAVSITHGISELIHPEPASDYVIAYVVLAIAFVLEGTSFRQAFRQVTSEAARADRDILEHALVTSDPTLRAVFAEDAAALLGLLIAFSGVLAHQLTGSPVPDAIGSIAVGVLLGVVAIVLVDRNRRFLLGEEATGRLRDGALDALIAFPEISRVTYLRLEYVGPRQVYFVAAVDLVGDEREHDLAVTLRRLEHQLETHPAVVHAVLTLSADDEPTIER